jgi:sigma-B regulation protein RsbU (phosphoserine phosphatase)
MAVTHSIAHSLAGDPYPPSRLMCFVNRQLSARYTNGNGTFVTAFYGVYDPATRVLSYCSGGHCVPRVWRGDRVIDLELARFLPLGIDPEEKYGDGEILLENDDALILYTDGITEARKPQDGELFGIERLDRSLVGDDRSAAAIVQRIVLAADEFSGTSITADDQTLVVARMGKSKNAWM